MPNKLILRYLKQALAVATIFSFLFVSLFFAEKIQQNRLDKSKAQTSQTKDLKILQVIYLPEESQYGVDHVYRLSQAVVDSLRRGSSFHATAPEPAVNPTIMGTYVRNWFRPNRETETGGLRARYLNSSGNLAFERIDPAIDFDWGADAPETVNTESFSVLWTGMIRPSTTDTYNFIFAAEGSVFLTIDDYLVINNTKESTSGRTQSSGEFYLTSDRWHSIEVVYIESVGNASVGLSWENSNGENRQIVGGGFVQTETSAPETVTSDILAEPLPGGLGYSDICDQIEAQDIDQVWVWADVEIDKAPMLEYIVSSSILEPSVAPGILYATGNQNMFCGGERDFVIMGFDYSPLRFPEGYALESFGHLMEGLVTANQSTELYWYRFAGDDTAGYPRFERCGNDHWPPNAQNEYGYDDPRVVANKCHDWDPELATQSIVDLSCTTWNCNRTGYFEWWLSNMPNLEAYRTKPLQYDGGGGLKNIPNWWDFLVDTDNTVRTYWSNRSAYWMNPALEPYVETAANFGPVSSVRARQINETKTVSWYHKTIDGPGRLLVVTAAYRAANNTDAQINGVSYCDQLLTFVRRDKIQHQTTELWYLSDPQVGNCKVKAEFNKDPEDHTLSSFIVYNTDQVNPIGEAVGKISGAITDAPGNIGVEHTGPVNSMLVGVLSTYPDDDNNKVTPREGTSQVWDDRGHNILSLVAAKSRKAEEQVELAWDTTKTFPWSFTGVNINKKELQQASPTPTEIPSGQDIEVRIKFSENSEENSKLVNFLFKQRGSAAYMFTGVRLNLDASGFYSGKISGVAHGLYDVFVFEGAYLQKYLGQINVTQESRLFSWVLDTPRKVGDFNGDSVLDITDIASLLAQYTRLTNPVTGSENQIYDVDKNGAIDIADIATVLASYTELTVVGDY